MKAIDRERLRRLKAEAALTTTRRRLSELRDELASANDRAAHADAFAEDSVKFVRFIAKGLIGDRATEDEIAALIEKWHAVFQGKPRRRSVAIRLGPEAISRAIEGVLRRRLMGDESDDDETTE